MDINEKWPKIESKLFGSKILVLAPHVDDEVIGCGGTIKKYTQAGADVRVVYCTNSAKGMIGSNDGCDLTQIRKDESEQVCELLGVKKKYYLGLEDGKSSDWIRGIEPLKQIFIDFTPDVMFLPIYYDIHPDHQKVNKLIRELEDNMGDIMIYAYEIWSPINANVIINITKEMVCKMQAIHACKSQLQKMPYDKLIISLGAYRACFNPFPGVEYAEAFLKAEKKEYIRKMGFI